MKNILDFLAASPAFHVATVDSDNRPHVRPFSFAMEWEDRLTFVTGASKPVYRQLEANPYVEICSYNDKTGEWMRISGRIELFKKTEANRKVFEVMPSLKNIYRDESNPELVCFSIVEGQATTYSFTSPEPKIVKL